MTQATKLRTLAEGLDFDGDLDAFTKKVSIVKGKYFNVAPSKTLIEEETFDGGDQPTTKSNDPSVNRYAAALSRTAKK
jgi:hypothetical protein